MLSFRYEECLKKNKTVSPAIVCLKAGAATQVSLAKVAAKYPSWK